MSAPEVYLVGGAVRDQLLGLPVQDRDWVVVGGTAQDLLARGFTPVGQDFPVFLNPHTHEEYALARTERKSGHGYKGFAIHASPDVTLAQDLARRDLCINAMALPARWTATGAQAIPGQPVIDPYGGQRDLAHKLLRHVTDAFAEDPVRILRVARFAARYPGFAIAPETLALMQRMVHAGEADHLVPERVWQELARGLMSQQPARMLHALHDSGALRPILPELHHRWSSPLADGRSTATHTAQALDIAAVRRTPLPVRWACLLLPTLQAINGPAAGSGQLPRHLGQRLRVPGDCTELAQLLARERSALLRSTGLSAEALLQLLTRCDALRKPERFAQALQVLDCLHPAPASPTAHLRAALAAAQSADANAAARAAQAQGAQGPAIGQAIAQARTRAIAAQLQLPA